MPEIADRADQALEQLMKDAITSYMLDSFEIEDRLKAAVHKIADELLAEKLAALRAGAEKASAGVPTELCMRPALE